jgi:hypothetical protein
MIYPYVYRTGYQSEVNHEMRSVGFEVTDGNREELHVTVTRVQSQSIRSGRLQEFLGPIHDALSDVHKSDDYVHSQ